MLYSMQTTKTSPECYAHLSRLELIDHILRLVKFDLDGSRCDEAMGLMRWNDVTSEELRSRHLDVNRPILLPL